MCFLVPITTTHSMQTYYSLVIFTGSPNQQIKITVNISAYVYGSSVIINGAILVNQVLQLLYDYYI